MIFTLLLGCEEPPPLSRVSDGLGAEVRDRAEPAVAVFVSAAALVGEACGELEVDTYTFSGEGARAFHVSLAAVTVNETSGTRTWNFGDVYVGDDLGNLTIVTDSGRQGYTATFSGGTSAMAAEYTLLGCEGTDATNSSASVSGSGHFTTEADSAELTIGADSSVQALEWAPVTAGIPNAGWVRWKIDGATLQTHPADEIDASTRMWPGLAEGDNDWTAEVSLLLP